MIPNFYKIEKLKLNFSNFPTVFFSFDKISFVGSSNIIKLDSYAEIVMENYYEKSMLTVLQDTPSLILMKAKKYQKIEKNSFHNFDNYIYNFSDVLDLFFQWKGNVHRFNT